MRIYLASTGPALARLAIGDDGALADVVAHAVTPALREWYAESDLDELEHAAFLDAARGSLRALAADPGAPRRRVVLSADVADDAAFPTNTDDDDRSAVGVRGVVPLASVVSVHVDEDVAQGDVEAAVAALGPAAAGDEDAQFVVDGAEGHDLLWYDITELADVVADLLGQEAPDQDA